MTFTLVTVLLVLLGVAAALVLIARDLWVKDDDEGTWRLLVSIFAGIGAALALLFALLFPVVQVTNKIVCRNSAANLELPYKYSISAGCYVRYHGQWIGIDKALGIVAK